MTAGCIERKNGTLGTWGTMGDDGDGGKRRQVWKKTLAGSENGF